MKVAQLCPILGAHGLYCLWNSSGQNTGVDIYMFLLQGIFPTQGLNPGLLHCRWIFFFFGRWILYQLSHQYVHIRPTYEHVSNVFHIKRNCSKFTALQYALYYTKLFVSTNTNLYYISRRINSTK